MFLFWKIMFSTIFGIRETCRFQNWCSFLFCKMGTLKKNQMLTMPKMYCNMQHTPSTYSHTCHTVQCSEETVLQHVTHPLLIQCSLSSSVSSAFSWSSLWQNVSRKMSYSGPHVRPITGCTCRRRHLSTNERRPGEL